MFSFEQVEMILHVRKDGEFCDKSNLTQSGQTPNRKENIDVIPNVDIGHPPNSKGVVVVGNHPHSFFHPDPGSDFLRLYSIKVGSHVTYGSNGD